MFSFDPEKLTHAKPLEKKSRKDRKIVVFRRGAGIISDAFNRKKKKKGDQSPEDKSQEASQSQQQGQASNPTRPASLVVTPPTVGVAPPDTPRHPSRPPGEGQPPGEGDGRSRASGGNVGGVGRPSCEPCTAASARCCQCQCHTRNNEGQAVAPAGASGAPGRPACDDQKPLLRLVNNAPHKQPSLDDSGVVGDDGADNISLPQPHQPQVGLFFTF